MDIDKIKVGVRVRNNETGDIGTIVDRRHKPFEAFTVEYSETVRHKRLPGLAWLACSLLNVGC